MKYKRILLKLSGQALMGDDNQSLNPKRINQYANEIRDVINQGVEVAIVIGGGNIFRGLQGKDEGIDRVQGDYMGMLATIINSLALQNALDDQNIKSCILSGIAIDPIAEKISRRRAINCLEKGFVVFLSGGTGNPYFTTDSAAALRALEIKADIILKGTRVDGVYSSDPEKNPLATKYNHLTFIEAYEKKLKIMDMTAFTLCRDNNLPIVVFNINKRGNLEKVVAGENIGTLVSN